MKKITGIKTYRYSTGFYLETGYCTHPLNVMITEDRDRFEAMLYCDDLASMYFMFGTSKASCTLDGFLSLVEANLPEYIAHFERETALLDEVYSHAKG